MRETGLRSQKKTLKAVLLKLQPTQRGLRAARLA
jgi:hypothetical protein